jgi:Sec7-like guanine-nucleotide exchange factor
VVDGPRLHSLQKVVECAYHNMDRIRLVWSKLWAVIAAQLVGASCHPHRRVTGSVLSVTPCTSDRICRRPIAMWPITVKN